MAVREHIDALSAHDLAEQAKKDAEGVSAQLGQLVTELRINGLDDALEASSKSAEEKAAEVKCMLPSIDLRFALLFPSYFMLLDMNTLGVIMIWFRSPWAALKTRVEDGISRRNTLLVRFGMLRDVSGSRGCFCRSSGGPWGTTLSGSQGTFSAWWSAVEHCARWQLR